MLNYLMSLMMVVSGGEIVLIVLASVLAVLLVLFMIFPIGTWFRAVVSNARVRMGQLFGMKLRRMPYRTIANAYIMARKGGLDLTVEELEVHCMAGGNVLKLINALISAKAADIPLTAQKAKMMDLRGEDVLETVKAAVREKNALREPENNF